MFRSAYSFIIRYKVLHIIFWVWVTISLAHELQVSRGGDFIENLQYAIILEFFAMLSVYFTIYFLTPRYFNKQKYFQFVVLTLLAIFITSALTAVAHNVFSLYVVNGKIPGFFYARILSHSFDTIVKTIAFMAVVIIQNRIETDNKNKLIERERLVTELNFLKAQLNPHFLFNALNSIYVLMKEDIKLSEQTLLKFSSLLRYQLYDCKNNETTMENEIEFLKNYIALEKVRNAENLHVNFTTPEKITYLKMAPFILIPFVENAFKHISHFRDTPNTIEIKMSGVPDTFHFVVENTCDESFITDSNTYKGIGLQNVKRRLELLYPQKHSLQLNRKENIYSVTLHFN